MGIIKYRNKNLIQGITLPKGEYQAGFCDLIFFDEKRQRQIKAALWYPTYSQVQAIFYRDTFPGVATRDAEIIQATFPVILVSHGSEGHRFNQHYLAEYIASHGYMVLAIEHQGDNAFDNTLSKSILNLYHRPQDVSFALDMLLQGSFKKNIDIEKIGFAGHSFGGYTGMTLLGAVPDFATIKLNEEDESIQFNKRLSDIRIRCAFLMAPALAQVFTIEAMRQLSGTVALMLSGQDEYLKFDNKWFVKNLRNCIRCVDFVDAGHYIYLMECPEEIIAMNEVACYDIGSYRRHAHPFLKKHMLDFFNGAFNGG